MNKTSESRLAEIDPEILDIIASTMQSFHNEMQQEDTTGRRIAKRTQQIMRVVFSALMVSSVVLVYLIIVMSRNMTTMTGHLEDMYSNFGHISDNMKTITLTVRDMQNDIDGMLTISNAMSDMEAAVSSIDTSVGQLNLSLVDIDRNMSVVNSHMDHINSRMALINYSVYRMRGNVYEMAKPVNFGPFSGIW